MSDFVVVAYPMTVSFDADFVDAEKKSYNFAVDLKLKGEVGAVYYCLVEVPLNSSVHDY